MKLWPSGDLQGATLASHWTFTPSTTGGSPCPDTSTSSGPRKYLDQFKSCRVCVPGTCKSTCLCSGNGIGTGTSTCICPGPGTKTGTCTSYIPGTVCGPGPGTGTDTGLSPGHRLCLGPDLKLLVLRRSVVVIGAPKATNNQSGVEEGGAVYLCPWNTGDVSSSMCDVINLDGTGVLAPPPLPSCVLLAVCVCASDNVTCCAR